MLRGQGGVALMLTALLLFFPDDSIYLVVLPQLESKSGGPSLMCYGMKQGHGVLLLDTEDRLLLGSRVFPHRAYCAYVYV